MIPIELATWLEQQKAAKDVVDWARPFGTDVERAWNECPRGDWLLAIAARAKVPLEPLTEAAAACARAALEYVDAQDTRPQQAVEAAEKWARDSKGSLDAAVLESAAKACAAAARAAEAAMNEAKDPVIAAAALSAYAAARTSVSPDEAATAPAAAAEAATLAADECAAMSAYRYTIQKTAAAVRAAIPWSLVAPGLSGAGRS